MIEFLGLAEEPLVVEARRAAHRHAPHVDCTCCRAWRIVELPTAIDVADAAARIGRSWQEQLPPAHRPLLLP